MNECGFSICGVVGVPRFILPRAAAAAAQLLPSRHRRPAVFSRRSAAIHTSHTSHTSHTHTHTLTHTSHTSHYPPIHLSTYPSTHPPIHLSAAAISAAATAAQLFSAAAQLPSILHTPHTHSHTLTHTHTPTLSTYPPIHLSTYAPIHLSVCPSIHLSIYPLVSVNTFKSKCFIHLTERQCILLSDWFFYDEQLGIFLSGALQPPEKNE
jgi:hypothetical protein